VDDAVTSAVADGTVVSSGDASRETSERSVEVEVVLGVSVVGLVSTSGSLDVEVRSDLLVAALLVVEVVTDSTFRVLAAVGGVGCVACTKQVEVVFNVDRGVGEPISSHVEVVTDSAGRVLAAVGSVFAVACTKPVEAVSDARLISVYPIQEVVADDAVTSAVADGAVVSKLRDA
jgi:drug/metabolite transporter superfamily protein YnfA